MTIKQHKRKRRGTMRFKQNKAASWANTTTKDLDIIIKVYKYMDYVKHANNF